MNIMRDDVVDSDEDASGDATEVAGAVRAFSRYLKMLDRFAGLSPYVNNTVRGNFHHLTGDNENEMFQAEAVFENYFFSLRVVLYLGDSG